MARPPPSPESPSRQHLPWLTGETCTYSRQSGSSGAPLKPFCDSRVNSFGQRSGETSAPAETTGKTKTTNSNNEARRCKRFIFISAAPPDARQRDRSVGLPAEESASSKVSGSALNRAGGECRGALAFLYIAFHRLEWWAPRNDRARRPSTRCMAVTVGSAFFCHRPGSPSICFWFRFEGKHGSVCP